MSLVKIVTYSMCIFILYYSSLMLKDWLVATVVNDVFHLTPVKNNWLSPNAPVYVHSYKQLTNSTEECVSWKAEISSANHKFPSILCKPKVHYVAYSLPRDLDHNNTFQELSFYFFKIM